MKMYPGTAEFGFLIHIGLQIIYVVKRMTNVDDRFFCDVDFRKNPQSLYKSIFIMRKK